MNEDRTHLLYIMDCIARIQCYVADGREAFTSSRLIQDAVVRNLQTLAESTTRITDPIKTAHPEVDWRSIAAFRNVIVHNYLGVDLDQVWDIVERDLPELKLQVTAILQELEGEG